MDVLHRRLHECVLQGCSNYRQVSAHQAGMHRYRENLSRRLFGHRQTDVVPQRSIERLLVNGQRIIDLAADTMRAQIVSDSVTMHYAHGELMVDVPRARQDSLEMEWLIGEEFGKARR